MGFGARIIEAVRRAGTPLVVGIDPREEEVPLAVAREAFAKGLGANATRADMVRGFSRTLVGLAAGEGIAAVKLQSAFFEAAGPEGMAAFAETLALARSAGLIAIADVKRGDIGSTAKAYASAFFGTNAPFRADAITASPLLGGDSLEPLVNEAASEGAGVFVLVRTSNPGAADLQELEIRDGRRLTDAIAALVTRYAEETRDASGYGAVGAVVGATVPEAASRLRSALPASILLAPGVGAQGAAAAALKPFFDANGEGALVPVSRAISGAWQEAPRGTAWEDACRAAIRRFKAEIAAVTGAP